MCPDSYGVSELSAQIEKAREFVAHAELPIPIAASFTLEEAEASPVNTPAAVVGSALTTFQPAVDPTLRRDITNATLFAQLVSKKQSPEPTSLEDLARWYQSYFSTLAHLGFAVLDTNLSRHDQKTADATAHQSILDFAAAALVGSASALLVSKAIDAIKNGAASEKWITLFNRETRVTRTGRFQVSEAELDLAGHPTLRVSGFALEARTTLAQVLVFKVRTNEASLETHQGRFGITESVLSAIREPLAVKLGSFATQYVETIPDL